MTINFVSLFLQPGRNPSGGGSLNTSSGARPSSTPSSNLALVNAAKQQYGSSTPTIAATTAATNDLRRRINASNAPAASPGLAPATARTSSAGSNMNVSRLNETSMMSSSFSSAGQNSRRKFFFIFYSRCTCLFRKEVEPQCLVLVLTSEKDVSPMSGPTSALLGFFTLLLFSVFS